MQWLAAAGHSLGGMTTVGLFTKFRDERISAGIEKVVAATTDFPAMELAR